MRCLSLVYFMHAIHQMQYKVIISAPLHVLALRHHIKVISRPITHIICRLAWYHVRVCLFLCLFVSSITQKRMTPKCSKSA